MGHGGHGADLKLIYSKPILPQTDLTQLLCNDGNSTVTFIMSAKVIVRLSAHALKTHLKLYSTHCAFALYH